MSLQKLKEQAFQLPESDRLEPVRAIIESLQNQPSQKSERTSIIKQMKGLLKTNQPAPTNEQIKAMEKEAMTFTGYGGKVSFVQFDKHMAR